LFGNTAQQQNKPAAPSLFGATQQNQPQQQNTMFGMASQNTGAQPVQGGIQIKTIDSIKGTTRFSELHPDFQNEIQKLDDIFQGHMSNSQRIREILPQQGETVASLAPDVSYIEQFLSTMELGIDNDSGNVAGLKELVQRDIEEAKLCGRAVTNQTLPAQFRYGNAANLTASTANPQATTSADDDDPTKPVDLVPYFSHRADNLSATLELYQRQVREIEAHLRTMEAGTVEKAQQLAGRSGIRDQKKELIEALRAMEGAILDAAKKVGKTRDLAMQHTLGSVGGAVL
jgi:nucleoporin p58/p45